MERIYEASDFSLFRRIVKTVFFKNSVFRNYFIVTGDSLHDFTLNHILPPLLLFKKP